MKGIYITVIIQAIITICLLYYKNSNKSFYFLYIYLGVIVADFIYELFLYQLFDNQNLRASFFLSSFRVLKGPLLLFFLYSSTNKIISKKTYLLSLSVFFVLFFHNILALPAILGNNAIGDQIAIAYQRIIVYYPVYWYGYLLFIAHRLSKIKNPLTGDLKFFSILIAYLLISVGLYIFLAIIGIDQQLIREWYSYLFLVQFAIIVVIRFKSYTSKLTNEIEETGPKYKTSNHSQVYLKEIADRLHVELHSNKSYLNEDLNLDDLALSLKISRHTLSQVIAETPETNFYDLINKYRLEEFVKTLKADPSKSISEIFYQCGFKSRTTFYKYFNKHMGESPTDFKKRISFPLVEAAV